MGYCYATVSGLLSLIIAGACQLQVLSKLAMDCDVNETFVRYRVNVAFSYIGPPAVEGIVFYLAFHNSKKIKVILSSVTSILRWKTIRNRYNCASPVQWVYTVSVPRDERPSSVECSTVLRCYVRSTTSCAIPFVREVDQVKQCFEKSAEMQQL